MLTSPRSPLRGSLEYQAWILGLGAMPVLGLSLVWVKAGEALADVSTGILTICAIAAFGLLVLGYRRAAVLAVSVPIAFSASAFAALAPLERQVLGMKPAQASGLMILLVLLAVGVSVHVTRRASDVLLYENEDDSGCHKERPNWLHDLMLAVFFTASPSFAAYALYFAYSYTRTHEYLHADLYVWVCTLLLAGLFIAFVAGVLAERSNFMLAALRKFSPTFVHKPHSWSERGFWHRLPSRSSRAA